MSEQMLIKHCAPTLAGLKTGNIFSCSYDSIEEMKASIRSFNRRLVKKGLRVLPIRYKNGRALIYVYRPALLMKDLDNVKAREILEMHGYSACEHPACCISKLMHKLENSEEFPHEIGLFLGYPPEDVQGFICEKTGKKCDRCKCVGHWKVYGDEEKAKKIFAGYKKCTSVYHDQWSKGKSIEKLTVNC